MAALGRTNALLPDPAEGLMWKRLVELRPSTDKIDPRMEIKPPGDVGYTLRDVPPGAQYQPRPDEVTGWRPTGGPTQLTPTGEAMFQQQAQPRMGDTADYDLRRAWAQQGGGALPPGHLNDSGGKLPNHPTFSVESPYSSPQRPGGQWVQLPSGQWSFWPSQANYDNFGRARLEDYFARVEPNSLLIPEAR